MDKCIHSHSCKVHCRLFGNKILGIDNMEGHTIEVPLGDREGNKTDRGVCILNKFPYFGSRYRCLMQGIYRHIPDMDGHITEI